MPPSQRKTPTTRLTFAGKRKKTRFVFAAPTGSKVFVAGSFNNWNPTDYPLRDNPKEAVFEATLFVPRGRHEYKFIVNGNWCPDPRNPQMVSNIYGSMNSVIEV